MKIDKDTRKAMLERIRRDAFVTLEELTCMLDTRIQEQDVMRLIENEKKRTARTVLASVRDARNVRIFYALCDKQHTFVNVERRDAYEKLITVESQLKAKRNGLNRSLGKVAGIKRALDKCVMENGADSEEVNAMADKLYAMVDELQSFLSMRLSA